MVQTDPGSLNLALLASSIGTLCLSGGDSGLDKLADYALLVSIYFIERKCTRYFISTPVEDECTLE
jgi:hypothetical protein